MAVRDGIERRHVSAPERVWQAIDAIAARSGRTRYSVVRAVLEIGVKQLDPEALDAVCEVIDQERKPLPLTPAEIDRCRETYRRVRKAELAQDRAADALWRVTERN